ncbi:MAG: amino acid decarboxylase, partial [Clostridia bacterium]|nr:amino acid decarboxylase [Clostridia bacterium]
LLDIDVEWLFGGEFSHFCECRIEAKDLEERLEELRVLKKLPDAVYITSPDYLGHIADIEGLSRVCDNYKIPLLVDNAHGAYLSFLKESKHPLDLGASICCDSAHKTLPVLTGGAYLHISKKADPEFARNARRMLSLFASTSPSYLMLESLDACNAYLSDGYVERLESFVREISRLKERLLQRGYQIESGEPMKIVISAIGYSFYGVELAKFLRERKIEIEFADRDFTVLMPTPENDIQSLKHLEKALLDFEFEKISNDRETKMKAFMASEREMSIREAMFAEFETVDCDRAVGRICAAPTVSCPPAVPIAVSGERINSEQAELLKYYGIEEISVVK